MRRWLNRVLCALLTGYIFVFFSEISFWARPIDSVTFPGIIGTWLVYAFAAYLFLGIVGVAAPRRWSTVFLVGALFGWFVEGVFVQTMYLDFPFNISYTGLAWHALFTISVGWYLIQRTLRASFWATAGWCAVVGAGLGIWATSWWSNTGYVTPLPIFARYMGVTSLSLMLAYLTLGRVAPATFRLRWGEWAFLGVCTAAWLVFVTIPTVPFALVILPPCLALVIFDLWRLRKQDAVAASQPLAWQRVTGAFPPIRVFGVVALPVTAIAIYVLGLLVALPFNVGILYYLVTMPLGFFLLARATVQAIRSRRRQVTTLKPPVSVTATNDQTQMA